jgi:hypothetical protein
MNSSSSYGLSYRLDDQTGYLQLSIRVDIEPGLPLCVACIEINFTDIRIHLLDMV